MNIGYCTNIHGGGSVAEVVENLIRHAVPIKLAVSPDEPLGIGLWLSHEAVAEALSNERWRDLQNVLVEYDLVPHTFNAFPWSDFHRPVVKHDVYLPTWADHRRLDYTLAVARLQDLLLPPDQAASISTLPIGWPDNVSGQGSLDLAKLNLRQCACELAKLADQSGRHTILAIEPEPGCYLQTSETLCDFFVESLLSGPDESLVRQHIGVCHDVCHAAVMFESQASVLNRYQSAGIQLAKIQVSSAIETKILDNDERDNLIEALAEFTEPRYLHQTIVRCVGEADEFFDDLASAIDRLRSDNRDVVARTHFHVPIHQASIGALGTTQGEIVDCLNWVAGNTSDDSTPHIEVETYAWSVSPEALRGGNLADSVVAELRWLYEQLPASPVFDN